MPYRITWEDQGLYSRFWGKVDLGQIMRMMDVIGADERFDAIHYVLSDYLDVTEFSLTTKQIDEIVALDIAQSYSNARYYSLGIAKDEKIRRLLEYWTAVHMNPERVGVFESLEQARAWIAAQPLFVALRWMPMPAGRVWKNVKP